MADKQMVSSKMGSRTVERLEEYKDREGISKSQAVERMVKQGLDVEESDMRLVPVKTDGGTMIENKIDSVENSLDSQSEAIQRQQSNQVVLNVTLIGSLVWIFLQLFYGFSQWFTLTSGLGIILLLIGLLYKVRTNV